MKVAPNQKRYNSDHTVTCGVLYGSGKLKILSVFPGIFKGELIHHKDVFEARSGHEITVTFDSPCPLQIDGETILDVTTYTVNY